MTIRAGSRSHRIFPIRPVYHFNQNRLRGRRHQPSFPNPSDVNSVMFVRGAESDRPIRADGIPKRRWRDGSERSALSLKYPSSVTGCLSLTGKVGSLYFTSEVTGSLKSDFSAANLHLNQYSLCNHLREKGLARSRELQQRAGEIRRRSGGIAIHPAVQIRVWVWKTCIEYQVKDGRRAVNLGDGTKMEAQKRHWTSEPSTFPYLLS